MSLSPYGLVELPVWGYPLVTFVTIQTMFLGVTLYLHRDQSHGGLILHPALRHVFRFWLWFSSGAITKEWVAVHRRHHAHADQPGDPHSPVVFGLRRVLFEGYELYGVAAHDAQTLKNYGRGTPQDWLERRLYSGYPRLGIVGFVAAHLLLFGVAGIVMIAWHLVAQPFFAGGFINGLGHAVGYRSFEMPSTATNLVPWALLLGGEELHNNHHAFPRSARFAVQCWEIDIGWLWIRLFSALGLARVRWVAPRPQFEPRRRDLDADTVNALFTNRMHVLRDYARRVVLPVCRALARREPRGASCSRGTRCCAGWSSTATACNSCGTGRLRIRHAPWRSCVSGAAAPRPAASARCATSRKACPPTRAASARASLEGYLTGRLVARVTVRMAKLECTRATLGRRVRCWL